MTSSIIDLSAAKPQPIEKPDWYQLMLDSREAFVRRMELTIDTRFELLVKFGEAQSSRIETRPGVADDAKAMANGIKMLDNFIRFYTDVLSAIRIIEAYKETNLSLDAFPTIVKAIPVVTQYIAECADKNPDEIPNTYALAISGVGDMIRYLTAFGCHL